MKNEIGDLIQTEINNLSIENTKRNVAAALLHDVVFDTQRAIHDLVAQKHFGSASALLRVLFEAHVKALWVEHCATEKEIDQLNKDSLKSRINKNSSMSFQEMIDHIESHNPEMKGSLSDFKRTHWRGLNSLTHSGASQFRNRFNGFEIKKSFNQEFVSDLIAFSDRFAIASFLYLSRISKNIDLIQKAIRLCSEKLNINP